LNGHTPAKCARPIARGRRPDRAWLTQIFALEKDTLKIDCTLHALPDGHVSQLITAGMNILTISRRLDHTSAAITLRVYGHLFDDTDAKAAEIMEAAFAKMRERLS
jgi:integrase